MSLCWEMAAQSGEKDQRKISKYVLFPIHIAQYTNTVSHEQVNRIGNARIAFIGGVFLRQMLRQSLNYSAFIRDQI